MDSAPSGGVSPATVEPAQRIAAVASEEAGGPRGAQPGESKGVSEYVLVRIQAPSQEAFEDVVWALHGNDHVARTMWLDEVQSAAALRLFPSMVVA